MKFKEYYYNSIIKEDPDTVRFSIDGSRVNLIWNMYSATPFGFINGDATFEFKGASYKFFNDVNLTNNILIGGPRQMHGDIVNDYIRNLKSGFIYVKDTYKHDLIKVDLSDIATKNEIFKNRYAYPLAVTSHKILMPCGRIWVGEVKDGKEFNFISFWGSRIPITNEHIEQVLETFLIPESEWDSTYIEFINQEDTGNRLTYSQIRGNISDNHEKQKEFKSMAADAHLAAGFGAAFKDKRGMGSLAQGKKASKVGFDNFAKYKDARYPHRESTEQI